MIKKIIISLIILGCIGGAIGLYMFNKPLETTSSLKTEFQMNAETLLMAFEENENTANTKYLDKVIEVKGSVQKVEKDDQKTTIYLKSNNPMSSVIFQLEDANITIHKGEEITLKGICTGYLMDVVMVRGVKV